METTKTGVTLFRSHADFEDKSISEANVSEYTMANLESETCGDTPRVLHPDSNLMQKFQQTLGEHLTRVLDRLSEETLELEASIKKANKELDTERTRLYYAQEEVVQQRENIKQYQDALNELALIREKEASRVENAKEIHKETRKKLLEEKTKRDKLSQELEKAASMQSQFSQWEKELNDYLNVSKRISNRDAITRKELIEQKQRKDYILYRLSQELMKVETEIAYLDEQLQIKDREKGDANRMIIEANTELETLQREQKQLRDTWNSILLQISKKDGTYDKFNSEREEMRKLIDEKSFEVERLKKDTEKEMETNEYLTSLSTRLESNIKSITKTMELDSHKVTHLESQLIQLSKLTEQLQNDYDAIYLTHRDCLSKEEQVLKDYESVSSKKNQLEQAILEKLEGKIVQDKTARYINDLLASSKEAVLEQELLLTKTENTFGQTLLQIERLTNELTLHKAELEEVSQKNIGKQKQIDEITKQIRQHEVAVGRKQNKLSTVTKSIDQILPNLGGKVMSPLDLQIISQQRNVQEAQQKILELRSSWMRQQGCMVSLSQQRNVQLQELNLLNKETMIMEQKNAKLEYTLEKLEKEEADINRIMNLFEQKLQRMNSDLVLRKDVKEELEGKNSIARNECMISFQRLELHLIKLQNELANLFNTKITLQEELEKARQESLSWEKKVQLTQEAMKKIKEENESGDMMLMRNEIHKMEIRLSQLRRVQEKLVHDMEFCVARRDIMIDKALGKSKRNPKEQHNRKIVIRKRITDYKTKIKQQSKNIKQTQDTIKELEKLIKEMDMKIADSQVCKEDFEKKLPDLKEEISQMEMIKFYNMQSLVWKQRKARLLRDIKNGRYKMLVKNVMTIEEDLQSEKTCRDDLIEIMEKTGQDFPSLKNSVHKILLGLRAE